MVTDNYLSGAYKAWKREIDGGIEKNAESLKGQRDCLNGWINVFTKDAKEGKSSAIANLEVCMNTRDKMDVYLQTLGVDVRITYELL